MLTVGQYKGKGKGTENFSMNKRYILLATSLCLLIVGCTPPTETTSSSDKNSQDVIRQAPACPETILPWNINYLLNNVKDVVERTNIILQNTGLAEQGETIINLSKQYEINPAFALSMFRKEASFASRNSAAYRNNNPGNITATGNCQGLAANQSCNGYYGEISTDGRFGKYQSMADGIKAYYVLLSSEYKPGTKRNCTDITCIVNIYAPPTENNTAEYIQQVSDWTQEYQCKLLGAEKTPILGAAPAQPEISTTLIAATVQSPSNDSNTTGIHFSGQGPTTWPIQKDIGMVLLHVKVENCSSLVISGKGQNIPYMSTTLPAKPGQFEDQYQYYNIFQGSPDREETIILDYPVPWNDDYDTPPQTEMLRIEEISDDCKWEVTILPMTAARPIAPGQVLIGEYNDVLAVGNDLRGLELLFMSPGHDRMLQDFGSIVAVTKGGISALEESPDDAGMYEGITSGTLYLVIDSQGYWELQGK